VRKNKLFTGVALLLLFLCPNLSFLRAEDYTSPDFILRDPVVVVGGNSSGSADFQYFSSTGQTAPGESSSPSFVYRAGFEYYPTATTPILSATPGNAQVSLVWTASVGALANVTDYKVGTSTVHGGPYTYDDVGNALSFVKSSLVNGAPYYFIVKANAGTLTLAQSAEVSATPSAPAPPPGGGGGGGGGGPPPVVTSVIFSGRAYPLSTVTLLNDASVAASTVADAAANFQITLTNLTGGNYMFSVYSEDNVGNRSSLLTFPISVTAGATTNVGGIFIAPTIAVDKSEVKQGDNIAIFGQSSPVSQITISVNSNQQFFGQVNSDANGAYLYNFDTSPLEIGQHSTKSKAAFKGEISAFGKSVAFAVGTQNAPPVQKCGKADLNCDGRVNLIDFSIAAYWYKRPLSAAFKLIEKDRLNGDGKIDLIDFSIMAYYWTG
jgi:hypothetical protein